MKKCIFLHIPKTGGNTTRNFFSYHYKKRFRSMGPGFRAPNFEKLSDEEKSNIDCLHGHFPFSLHELLPWSDVNYVAIIRDPVKRIVSLYTFYCIDLASGFYKIMPEEERKDLKSFVENIDKYSLVNGNNAQTRLIAGGRVANQWDKLTSNEKPNEENLLERAKHNIDKYFKFIGTLEKYEESLILIKKHMSFTKPLFYARRNTTKNKKPEMSIDVINLIKERNNLDIQLYEYVNERLTKEIENNKDFIKNEKKKLHRNNKLYAFYRNNLRPLFKSKG